MQLPKMLTAAEPFEIQRAIKPLLEGRIIRLELRDKATRGPAGSTAPTKAYWLVGSLDLGRLLRNPASGVMSTPERVTAEVKLEMRLD